MGNIKITYLGYNNFKTHKRGVENVIHFQSLASPCSVNYYLHWDVVNAVSRNGNLICIGIQKNFFWLLKLNFILYKIGKRDGGIFIHSHNPLMSIFALYQTNIFTVHDGLYYLAKSTRHRLYKFFWTLEKILYWRCKYVHFISEYSKKMSLFRYKKKFSVIFNTSHLEKYILTIGSNQSTNNFRQDSFKILTVRSMEQRSLIDLIINVAKELRGQKIEFFIAGKGPLLKHYREKIRVLGLENIKLLGYIPDSNLIEYYNQVDAILVTAAYGEGFGLPIIEGYLFNKPVIASNVCAIPEIIMDKDFLFENNSKSIVSKINLIMKLRSVDYRSYYNQHFSNNVVLSSMTVLYKKLM